MVILAFRKLGIRQAFNGECLSCTYAGGKFFILSYLLKKELITISLKKKVSFDELVQENRQQILKDKELLNQIEENLETKINQTDQRTAEEN
ncbi:FbpB family small basic protein [Oceanobacillus halotolerans]|uniref:FbpB family small basic protein n=1 Tax=Oceanobacillus halotolerans TaxID=2663380 RepID=UPI001CF7CD7C|nr:FbpB family small basic protein [Oceanobacillus halotolerans]